MAATSPKSSSLSSHRSSPLSITPAKTTTKITTSAPTETDATPTRRPPTKPTTSAPSPSTSKPAKPRPTLRILCLGDSLTSGWCPNHPLRPHPYAPRLSAVLSPAFPSLAVVADVDGVPGDTAARIARRAERRFLTRGGGTPYDWTVVLGGTNDVYLGAARAESVFAELRGVWGVPLAKGGRVLACTVPEGGMDEDVEEERERVKLNELIRGHKQEGFHVFDLDAAIPYQSMSTPERRRYWDADRCHLTPDGYDLMGEKIAAALVELIMPPGRLQPSAAARPAKKRRKNFRDDDKSFDEEDGDERSLDQGWIVVRRTDLQ